MKKELINKLFEEFIKDKDIIQANLMQAMDEIILEAIDEYGKLILTVKYERNNDK